MEANRRQSFVSIREVHINFQFELESEYELHKACLCIIRSEFKRDNLTTELSIGIHDLTEQENMPKSSSTAATRKRSKTASSTTKSSSASTTTSRGASSSSRNSKKARTEASLSFAETTITASSNTDSMFLPSQTTTASSRGIQNGDGSSALFSKLVDALQYAYPTQLGEETTVRNYVSPDENSW